jgi:hypothetical protein
MTIFSLLEQKIEQKSEKPSDPFWRIFPVDEEKWQFKGNLARFV